MPPTIIEKIEKFGKSYDDLTVETVKGFWLTVEGQILRFINFQFFQLL